MGTRQESFEIALKKGEIGEEIFRKYLEDRGWIVYFPFTKNKAHYFDLLATKDKSHVIACDVKTKARLNKWAATGIDIRHWNQYNEFCQKANVPFYLVFIDDKSGDVHAQELNKLTDAFNPTPYIIAWPLSCMKYLFNIGEKSVKQLSEYDTRTYTYNPNEDRFKH
jgi:hypothetical protein